MGAETKTPSEFDKDIQPLAECDDPGKPTERLGVRKTRMGYFGLGGIAALGALVCSGGAFAQEGLYGNKQQTAIIREVGAKQYSVQLETSSPAGCGGSLNGTGSMRGNIMVVEARDRFAPGACIVTIQFKNRSIILSEEANCTFFHGAACGFSGRLNKK